MCVINSFISSPFSSVTFFLMTLMTSAVCSTPALLIPLLFFYNTYLLTYYMVWLFTMLDFKNNSLFLAVLGLHCWAGYSLDAVRGPLIVGHSGFSS